MMQTNQLEANQNIQKEENSIYRKKVKFLQNYFWIIQDLLDELIRNQDDSSCIKASTISGMPKSQMIKTIDDVYLSKKYSKEKIEKKIEELYSKKKQIENLINKIDDPQLKYVLKNKYLFFKTIEEISINLNKSYKQITRWHTDAINKLELPDSVNN